MNTAELHTLPTTPRIPPHSTEAEQAVLGACLLDPSAIDACRPILGDSDWYVAGHRAIWRALCGLSDDGREIDVITVRDRLAAGGVTGRHADAGYVAELAENTPGTSNAAGYARIVREHGERREIIAAARRAAEIAYREAGGASRALQEFASVGSERQAGGIQTMREASREWLDTLERRTQGATGLMTGYAGIDYRWQGLRGGNLVVIAGRPGMGKTTLGMAICENIAEGGRALVFSLEMSAGDLLDRSLSRYSRVPHRAFRAGDLGSDDWPRLTAGIAKAPMDNLLIDDTGGIHISDLRARARAKHRESPLSIVMIDYLQLIQGSGENQNLKIANITGQLKALAKELNCPVLLLSQLNRSVEQRANKRPLMSDLRDSGAIEQDADIVCFAYRDEQYDKSSPRRGIMEVVTDKHRFGETGVNYLLTDLAHSTLTTPPDGWTAPPEREVKPRRFDGADL